MNKGSSLSGLSLFFCFLVFVTFPPALAQPLQREWVKNYFNVQTLTNQATHVAVAPDGNIVVAGTSQNTEGDLDYQMIKYKPNGDELWKKRYGTPDGGNDQLRCMTIDPSGNVFVTGTSDTLKINSAGALVWIVPLAGRAVVANTNFVYVTGFSDSDIATAQLENNDIDGRETWRRILDPRGGTDIGQSITMDLSGNVYVGAQEEHEACFGGLCHKVFAAVSYSSTGTQRWYGNAGGPPAGAVTASSIIVHPDGNTYVYGTHSRLAGLSKFNQNGSNTWGALYFGETGTQMIVERQSQKMAVTGRRSTPDGRMQMAMVVLFKGTEFDPYEEIWTYLAPSGKPTEGSDIGQDHSDNLYITGYSANDAATKAMFLAKITPSGRQLGLDRYNSPNAGSNFGTALAIDKNDNVYVTGYVLNTQGGSEFVTIKYSAAPKIEKKPSGAMHLEFHTLPGRQYTLEASVNFLNWQNLITSTADANGIVQFDDTNAPTIPHRFYRGSYFP